MTRVATILVVAWKECIRTWIKGSLERQGYEVVTASTLETAESVLRRQPMHLVIVIRDGLNAGLKVWTFRERARKGELTGTFLGLPVLTPSSCNDAGALESLLSAVTRELDDMHQSERDTAEVTAIASQRPPYGDWSGWGGYPCQRGSSPASDSGQPRLGW